MASKAAANYICPSDEHTENALKCIRAALKKTENISKCIIKVLQLASNQENNAV